MSNPQSKINICSGVRLNPSYEHTIHFDSATAQQSYFAGKVVKTFPAYSYLRKSWNIKVEATMEQAKTWTYLFFQNGTEKVYYYFIVNIEYINDNTVELVLELDVMQTYMFDYSLQKCFVEREHIADDTVGNNTLDENLELGELITFSDHKVDLNELCILVMASYDPMTTTEEYTDTVLAAKYNNIFSGLGIYAIRMEDWQGWGMKLNMLTAKLDGIVAMWMYPKNLVALSEGEAWDDLKVAHDVSSVMVFTETFSRNTTLSDDYTPRNNKLLCYPYNFLYVSNNQGGSAVYKYERFLYASDNEGEVSFNVCGALSPEGAVMMYPLHYNGKTLNAEESITLSGFPTCAWNQDMYKLWLAQNQNTHNLSLLSAGASIIAGVGTMAVTGVTGVGGVAGAGLVVGGVSQIANAMAQQKDMEIQPPQARGNHSVSVNTIQGFQTFIVEKKCVDSYHASIIDSYFDMYGYTTHAVKVPNTKVRENWTYTKTIGCHITGNICTEDQQKIESIYNTGITFWVNGDSIGDYGLSNKTL